MNGKQFIRRARKWANANGQTLTVHADQGKGGHQKLWIGSTWTTVKTGEIDRPLLAAMLKQLGIPKETF
jgi:hypothetical protein